ncbi:MAG: hypothetical protein H0T89_16315, partial [Deltaproteobacteria bacterium]|nr:hypothetical protein [Deltaproteobacteria bacterium]
PAKPATTTPAKPATTTPAPATTTTAPAPAAPVTRDTSTPKDRVPAGSAAAPNESSPNAPK